MESYSRIILAEPDRQVRLTINEFREKEYLHLREYYLDFDEEWKPTNKGIAIELNIETSKEMFIATSEIISLAESKQVVEEFFGELIRDVYQK
ncbi:MAG TPA: transcriptional regulator [Saprospirales bacterium]|nr:transcriptional regulator [Saprospirales bacterium]